MERADLQAYLAVAFAQIATELNVSLLDNTSGIAAELDTVYERVSAGTSAEATKALGEFFVIRRLRFAAAPRANFETLNMHPAREQIFQHLTDLLEEAAMRCANLGVPVDSSGAFEKGYLGLDYTEPTPPDMSDYRFWPM